MMFKLVLQACLDICIANWHQYQICNMWYIVYPFFPGNCETMMELLNFVKRLTPSKVTGSSMEAQSKSFIVSNTVTGTSSMVEDQFYLFVLKVHNSFLYPLSSKCLNHWTGVTFEEIFFFSAY